MIDREAALERALEAGDEWRSWRALKLSGDDPGSVPAIPEQDALGGFEGPGGRLSPGATGEAVSHLVVVGLRDSGAATIAADWLEEMRTPAGAWLDSPEEAPDVDEPAGGRVWATASVACALLALGRDPGSRALDLLRGESDADGRFTGGIYPTIAAAGAYWLAEGPKTETAEWGLRWSREFIDDFGPWELAVALTFWGAAGITADHASVARFIEALEQSAAPEGFGDDLELTVRTLELLSYFGE